MKKQEKMKRLGELLGVGWRQAYRYIEGQPAPALRAALLSSTLGGTVSLWIFSGKEDDKQKFFDEADLSYEEA